VDTFGRKSQAEMEISSGHPGRPEQATADNSLCIYGSTKREKVPAIYGPSADESKG
jgi:hypothetical protein